MLKELERIKAQCLAYYICSGEDFATIKDGNYTDRNTKLYEDYQKCCMNFASKVCDSMPFYSRADERMQAKLLENFTASLDDVFNNSNILYCELGIKIGFKLALDLGLECYKEKRGL